MLERSRPRGALPGANTRVALGASWMPETPAPARTTNSPPTTRRPQIAAHERRQHRRDTGDQKARRHEPAACGPLARSRIIARERWAAQTPKPCAGGAPPANRWTTAGRRDTSEDEQPNPTKLRACAQADRSASRWGDLAAASAKKRRRAFVELYWCSVEIPHHCREGGRTRSIASGPIVDNRPSVSPSCTRAGDRCSSPPLCPALDRLPNLGAVTATCVMKTTATEGTCPPEPRPKTRRPHSFRG